MNRRNSEQGVALLTVLILVAIISVIAAAMIERVRTATRLATNMAATSQARAYGLAAEAIAQSRVADLLTANESNVSLEGDWAGRTLPYPIDGGTATATMTDAGNCFNLNSVVVGSAATGFTMRPLGVGQFEGLLGHLGVPLNRTRPLALALADWVDSDTVPLPGGAEDGAYATTKGGLRTANTLMIDASELRVLRGMTPELYRLVRPWVCALPTADLSPVNVNTLAPAQAPLIAMLVPTGLDVATARRMIELRPGNGFPNLDAFWAAPVLRGVTPPAEAKGQLRLKTQWFGLDVTVALAGAELRSTALLNGTATGVRVIRRSYGDPV